MHISVSLLAAPIVALFTLGDAQAATDGFSVSTVLSSCPIEERVGKCANAVIDFISVQPRANRNGQIVAVVAALAEAAHGAGITPYMCAELQEGIRTAGAASSSAAQQQEIAGIADALCGVHGVDMTTTGAIGRGNAGNGFGDSTPVSIVGQPDPDDLPPITTPADDNSGDDGEILIN